MAMGHPPPMGCGLEDVGVTLFEYTPMWDRLGQFCFGSIVGHLKFLLVRGPSAEMGWRSSRGPRSFVRSAVGRSVETDQECEGDMQRLCVQEAASTQKLLRFAMCQDAAI